MTDNEIVLDDKFKESDIEDSPNRDLEQEVDLVYFAWTPHAKEEQQTTFYAVSNIKKIPNLSDRKKERIGKALGEYSSRVGVPPFYKVTGIENGEPILELLEEKTENGRRTREYMKVSKLVGEHQGLPGKRLFSNAVEELTSAQVVERYHAKF